MTFDAEAFQNSIITDANSTQTIPWPPGTYVGTIKKVEVKSGTVKKDGPNFGKPWAGLTVSVEVDRSALPEGASPNGSGMVMLDLTDSGGLDASKGRNIGLGRLREAAGLNTPGQAFQFGMLEGRTVKVSTGLRADNNNPEIQYTEIKAYAKP
jgi:hypothetical protein